MILWIENQTQATLDLEQIEESAKKTINEVLSVEGYDDTKKEAEISLTIVDRDTIHRLNRQYRNVDRPTDVLSFPIEDDIFMTAAPLMLGDIVICFDIAKEQAKDLGHSLDREFMYLICHSTLHLLGYDHIKEEDKIKMRSKEKQVMKNLGVFK